MKIAVDLDETLANFTKDFLRYYNEKHGGNFKIEEFRSYDLDEVIGLYKDSHEKVIEGFYESEIFENLTVVDGAKEAITELASDNELYIVTGRPVTMRDITVRWLDRNFPGVFEEVLITNTYSLMINDTHVTKSSFCQSIGAPLLIDDNLLFAEECADKDIKVLLLDYPWNKNGNLDKNITRVFSWQEIVDNVNEMKESAVKVGA